MTHDVANGLCVIIFSSPIDNHDDVIPCCDADDGKPTSNDMTGDAMEYAVVPV